MSSSEERSIPDAAPLPSQSCLVCGRGVDVREVVNHDWNGRSIEDLLEEADDSSSIITHSESEVAYASALSPFNL